jgi:hypothetical protein
MFYRKNRAKCLECGDVIESSDVETWIECSCGSLKIRGGSCFLGRECNKTLFKELSVIEFPEGMTFNEQKTNQPPPPTQRGYN